MANRVKTKTVNLGRLPVYCGAYNEDIAYHKYNIVTYYGSTFINLVEGNTKYPVNIVTDSSSRLISYSFEYIDGSWTGWMFVANSLDASIYATNAADYAIRIATEIINVEFKGNKNLITDLGLPLNSTNEDIAEKLDETIIDSSVNDYCYVSIPASTADPTQIINVKKFKFDRTSWVYEYDINSSVFTTEQWDAINSGVTSTKLSGYADKSEMKIIAGTGEDIDKTTIQLKNGTSAKVLKSHQPLKTINSQSIIGSGNIVIETGTVDAVLKVEIPKESGESVSLPENGYVFTWNGEATEYRDMYWNDESESKMIVFVARQYPLESGNSKLGKIWKAIVCDYDHSSDTIYYHDTYTDPNIPDNVLALFNEKEATTIRSGLMSADDKLKLNNIIVNVSRYKTENAILPIGDGYIYYDSSLGYGKYINLERISLAFDDEDGHIEGSHGSDNEPFYFFRNNVGQYEESFDVWDCYGRYHGCWDESGYHGPNADYTEAYRDDEHPVDVIGYIKEILCENLVSEDKDGLMSSSDKQKLDNYVRSNIIDIKDYMTEESQLPTGGVYIYYGLPTEFKICNEDGSDYLAVFGVMRESINDADELGQIKLVVLYDYNSENDYMTYRERQLAPNIDTDVLQLFNEEVATSDKKGLMSADDKLKLDNIIVDISRYMTEDARLPIDNGYIYYDSSLNYGKYINLERISLAFDDEDGHIKDSRGGDNGPFYIFRNNIGQDDESFDVWDWSGEYHGHWDESGYHGPKGEIYNVFNFDGSLSIDVIGYIKEILCENLVSEDKNGLMISSDKQKLDNLPTVFRYSQYCIPNGKIPFDTDFSNYILPCNVEMRRWRDNEYYYLCFAYNELGDIDETHNTDWRLRKSYYLFMLQDASGLDTDNYTYVGEYPNVIVLSDQTALGAKVAEAFGYSSN